MTRKPLFLTWILFHCVYEVASVFLHEPSHVEMKPSGEVLDGADFGFSIAYQNSTPRSLVIGSPHADFIGQVYRCPVESVSRKTECAKLDMQFENLTKIASDTNKEKERFCLGASIAATPDYFVTCAPLWRTRKVISPKSYDAAFGTCFVYYNDTTVHRYKGLQEQHSSSKPVKKDAILGGIGWSTLVNPDNNLMLIGKPALMGDIHYTTLPNPNVTVKKSLTFLIPEPKFGSDIFYYKKQIIINLGKNKQNNNVGLTMTSGNFFSDTNTTVYYAFYLFLQKGYGQVLFLKQERQFLRLREHNRAIVAVSYRVPGSMFGTVLHAADITDDGLADLLIGAPAHTQPEDDTAFDNGALYLVLGGDVENIDEKDRRRVVLGSKNGARFGSAIATNDIDADGLPEIFVSAPYEDSGVGALYILSGFEIYHTLIKPGVYKKVHLHDLHSTQTIQLKNFRSFGFSLQVVPDVDENGCDELAVGSPSNATVFMFKCVPAIKANVTLELVDKVVREYDKNFTVRVCVNFSFPPKPRIISTKFSVKSKVFGNGAEITKFGSFDLDLSRGENQCENVIVKLNYNDAGIYNFSSLLTTNIDELLKHDDFDSSWVTLSPYSNYESSIQITRYCSENDCTPHLEMSLFWAGSNTSDYVVGSTDTEALAVVVRNKGGNVYDACVRIRVSEQVVSIDCGTDSTGAYECYLPKPLKRNDETRINMLVNMTRSSTKENKLHIKALLYNNCNHLNATAMEKDINLHLSTEQVQVLGYQHHLIFDIGNESIDMNRTETVSSLREYACSSSHSIRITDTQVLKAQHNNAKIDDGFEYTVVNNGSIKWENITVSISLPKTSYIDAEGYRVPGRNCVNKSLDEAVEFTCTMDLMPHSTSKILVGTEILVAGIIGNLNNDSIEIVSDIKLSLVPTSEVLSNSTKCMILYRKELSVGNNKTFIIIMAVIIALIVLGVVVFILYKLGFFKRETKKRLETFRETVRRRSVRQPTSSGRQNTKSDDDDDAGIDIEVVEESPFEEEQPTTNCDDAVLIEKNETDEPTKAS